MTYQETILEENEDGSDSEPNDGNMDSEDKSRQLVTLSLSLIHI